MPTTAIYPTLTPLSLHHALPFSRQQTQLPRASRRARQRGLPLPSALPHGSRNDAASDGGGMSAMTLPLSTLRLATIAFAIGLALGSAPVCAQEMDHSKMQKPPPATPPPVRKPAAKHTRSEESRVGNARVRTCRHGWCV